MKNPFISLKNKFSEIPFHLRFKYITVTAVTLVLLTTVTVIATIDVNKQKEVDPTDPIESYDNVNVIPVEFDDETTSGAEFPVSEDN